MFSALSWVKQNIRFMGPSFGWNHIYKNSMVAFRRDDPAFRSFARKLKHIPHLKLSLFCVSKTDDKGQRSYFHLCTILRLLWHSHYRDIPHIPEHDDFSSNSGPGRAFAKQYKTAQYAEDNLSLHTLHASSWISQINCDYPALAFSNLNISFGFYRHISRLITRTQLPPADNFQFTKIKSIFFKIRIFRLFPTKPSRDRQNFADSLDETVSKIPLINSGNQALVSGLVWITCSKSNGGSSLICSGQLDD